MDSHAVGLRADRAALCDREDPSGDQTARERGEFLDELGRRADFRDLRLKATNDVSLIENCPARGLSNVLIMER